MHKLKLLFLLKRNLESGGYSTKTKCSGLYNSAAILAEELHEDFGIQTRLEIVTDGNSVDKFLHEYKPDVAIIEALWVTPEKLKELIKLHKNVVFIIRIHSEIPFLSNEGIAIEWIKKYANLPRTVVALNSEDTYRSFRAINQLKKAAYLPNIYDDVKAERLHRRTFLKQYASYRLGPGELRRLDKDEIDIGCFGAIRPIKNQLIQAFAAIQFANKYGTRLNFHMNSTRTEQGGESILKNIRSLFEMSGHRLIEHKWLDREDFLKIVKRMDLGMQVSFNESFNIVAADFVSQGVPVVVSPAIKWMPDALKVDPVDADQMVEKIGQCYKYDYLFKYLQYFDLHRYNKTALKKWKNFLES